MYCSDECANHDACHKEFCPYKVAQGVEIKQKCIMEALEIVGDYDRMVGLLMDDMKKTVFDFDLSNPDDPMYKKNLLIAVNSMSTAGVLGPCSSIEPVALPTEDVSKYLRIWTTNSYEMAEDVRVFSGPGSGMHKFSEAIGMGVFPFLSLLNHSCHPNVKQLTVDNKIVLMVSRPIKADEQIFVSYGYSYLRDTRQERKQGLARYKFNCDCVACIEDYPTLENLPRNDRRRFKEPDFGVYTTKAAIKQFKINCKYIENNAKKHPTYEVMKLIIHNYHLMGAAARIYFDETGIEYF